MLQNIRTTNILLYIMNQRIDFHFAILKTNHKQKKFMTENLFRVIKFLKKIKYFVLLIIFLSRN